MSVAGPVGDPAVGVPDDPPDPCLLRGAADAFEGDDPIHAGTHRMGVEGGVGAAHGRHKRILVLNIGGHDLDAREPLAEEGIGATGDGPNLMTGGERLPDLRHALPTGGAEYRH